jgi:hypothetical protein
VDRIERTGLFDGVHIISGVRHRQMADHLDLRLRRVAVGGPAL